jgi:hypothetical protein
VRRRSDNCSRPPEGISLRFAAARECTAFGRLRTLVDAEIVKPGRPVSVTR